MKHLFFVFLLMIAIDSSAQNVQLIERNRIEERLINAKDTAFVINFWATWCAPCIKELPYFEKLASEYKNEKLKVLLISLDFPSKMQSAVIPFVKRNNYVESEIYVLKESDMDSWINSISKDWSGAIPATLTYSKGRRSFYEREFVYDELKSLYFSLK